MTSSEAHGGFRRTVVRTVSAVSQRRAVQNAFFDELAESFAQRYENNRAFRDRVALFTEEARFVLDRHRLARSPRCLDLGCGPGIIAGAIANLGFEVIGVDRSEKMINVAERLAARHGPLRERLKFVRADVGEFLSSYHESFSLAVSSSVFEYLSDPQEVVAMIASRLEPGGTLAFSIPNFDSLLRVVEPCIQGVLPARSRYREFWGNTTGSAEYVRSAFDLGLSLERLKTFGLPNLSLYGLESVLRNRLFQTMTLLVFRRL